MPIKHTVEEVETKDGVRGLILSVPGAAAVHYDIFFRAGYLHTQEPMRQQTAHVLEHILYGWTKDDRFHTKREYLNAIYENGAYANATTYYNGSWHWGDNIHDEWRRVLELRKTAICNPAITAKALHAEKGNAKDEMRSNASNYERLSDEQARSGYGFPSETSPQKIESIDEITLADIEALYKAGYTKANMQFIVTGDFEHERSDIIDFFSDWSLPAGKALAPPIYSLRRGGVETYSHVAGIPNIFFELSLAIERRLSPMEQRALEILNARLFNVQNALVFEEARNRGICYRMAARVDMDVAGLSMWQISFPVAGEHMRELIGLLVEGLKDVYDNGLTAEDFDRAIRYSKGKFVQRGQTVSTLSELYFTQYFDDGIREKIDEAVYDSLTRERVKAVAKEFLDSRLWVVSGVGSVDEPEFKTLSKKLIQFLKDRNA